MLNRAKRTLKFKILISKFWPLGQGFRGFGPQIRLQHAEISPGTNSEVIWLELKVFGDPRLGTDTSGPGEAVFAIRFIGKP